MEEDFDLFTELLNLRMLLPEDRGSTHEYLMPYMAIPRSDVNNFEEDTCLEMLHNRSTLEIAEKGGIRLGFAPPDSSVFKLRLNFFAGNDQAYKIAMSLYPTAKNLEILGYKKPCWSILFPIKNYLWHHPAIAREYRGLLPIGLEVLKYLNEVDGVNKYESPDLRAHMLLRDMSNQMADALGIPSITINDIMYLKGTQL